MHSLFSRSRTTSTPTKTAYQDSSNLGAFDEFGRTTSRGYTPSKKDKKKDRSKTLPDAEQASAEPAPFPDGAFLPLNLERPRNVDVSPATPTAPHPPEPAKEPDYGYLSYERHVVLGLDQLERLVGVIAEELETRGGVTTPFIFSTTALDISSSAIRRVIRSFLNTCASEARGGAGAQEAERKWREEARFAGPHELGMCLRWGLARVIRSIGGQDVRGLVSWEHYAEFRESEAANGYPSTHFATSFLPPLDPTLQAIIVRLLSLLTRLVANSTLSGHTPPTLSPLFGPLFFGLGPATLAFHHAYIHYLRAVTAMEHIILSFVRWQDTPRAVSGSGASMGVPVRLKEWIKGYPSMLPFLDHKNKKPQPRRGARTLRVVSVRRNVRMYSPDLVKTASTWAHRPAGSTGNNGLANSKEWDRIAPATLKLAPRYSEAYKKRMDLPANFHPDVAPGAGLTASPSPSVQSTISSNSSLLPDLGLGAREGEDRFRSLTDLKWGEFESMGFNNLGDDKKLQFDLTESARTERAAKRQTLSWNDFSNAGFTRMDAPLSATLQFSTPFTNTISSWPAQNTEMTRKLKKAQKSLPAFGWDTEPVIGSEEVIEEAFVDVFCDLIYGGGWMDLERGEMLDRDCNWALVEYKSLPPNRTTVSGSADPRTSTTLLLFEEFVPLEYREALAVKSSSRRRLPSLFSSQNKKQWKQAPTLNGRPYIVGHVPHSPSYREVEFDTLLHNHSTTKVISANSTKGPSRIQSTISAVPTVFPPSPVSVPPVPQIVKTPVPPAKTHEAAPIPPPPKSDEVHSDRTASPLNTKKSRFRLPPTPGSNRKSMVPAEYSTVEFETRMASYSDDEANGYNDESEEIKQRRRESNSDAWVDILVGSQTRRLKGQDAEMPSERKRGLQRNRGSDPDLASLEVAQVLAAVQNRSPSPSSTVDRVDRDYGMDRHVRDSDVDEVETVPRTSEARSRGDDDDDDAILPYDESEQGHDRPDPLAALRAARDQRRVGYFAQHPERRAAITQSIADEDPRSKLANDDSDEEDDDERVYGAPEVPRTIRSLPVPPVVPQAAVETPAPASTATSKTAALIEMYRARESGTPTKASPAAAQTPPIPIVIAPLQPSRLPVRSTSLPVAKDVLTTPAGPGLPASPKPSPRTSPTPPPPEPLAASPLDAPRPPFEVETGRNSPARYQHGAPLHNVIEEEEE